MKRILIDYGRGVRGAESGLGQVSVQFAAALMRANAADLSFQFLTHSANAAFAAFAADIGAIHITSRFSLWRKLRRLADKRVHAEYYDGKGADVWHAANPHYLTRPMGDKMPLILTVHDLHFMNGRKRSVKRNLIQLQDSVNRASVVCFISNFTRGLTAQEINLDGKELRMIYNGVDKPANPQKPAWFNDSMRPFLFSVSAIKAHKYYHIMPAVMRYLPDCYLVLAGGTKNAEGISLLQKAIEKEKLNARIYVPGQISDGEKAFLLRECAGFVFPSQQEGFGMPIIEALHFGKPVFCFNNTALPEVGGDCVFYWQNDEPKDMAELIRQHIMTVAPESDIIARQQWAAMFSWDKNAAAYMDIYRQLGAK